MNHEDLLSKALHDHADTISQPMELDRLSHGLHHADTMAHVRRASTGAGVVAAMLLGGVAFGLGQNGGSNLSTAQSSDPPWSSAVTTSSAPTSTTSEATPPTSSPGSPGGPDVPGPDPDATTPPDIAPQCTSQQMNTYSTSPTEAVGYWTGTAAPGTPVSATAAGGFGSAAQTADAEGKWVLRITFSTSMPKNALMSVTVDCGATFTNTFTWYATGPTTTAPPTPTTTKKPPAPVTTTTAPPVSQLCTSQQMNTSSASPTQAIGYWTGTAAPGSHVSATAANGWGNDYQTVGSDGKWLLRITFSTSMPKNTPVNVSVTCVENGRTFANTFTWYATPPTTPAPTTTTTTAPAPAACTSQQMNTSSTSPTQAIGYWTGTAAPGSHVSATAANGWGSDYQTVGSDGKWLLRITFSTSMPKNTPVNVYVSCVEEGRTWPYTFTWLG